MQLSVVIPAYNEEARLPATFGHLESALRNSPSSPDVQEIIVVDDGSHDGTSALAERWAERLPIRTVRLPENRGKGAALRAGVLESKAPYALLYDADAATPFDEAQKLAEAMEKENADIAIGSRVLGRAPDTVQMSLPRRIIGRIYHALTAPLIPGIRDAACGCKLFKTSVAKELFSRQKLDRFAYDVEILSLALARGYKVAEVPVAWREIPGSKVRILRDGPEMLVRVLQLYLRHMSRIFLQILSRRH
jgi:dolichyl-phosphate beta-glucosyltransferase